MNPISTALRLPLAYSSSPPQQTVSLHKAAHPADSPSAQVNLGLDTRVADAQTYSARGSLGTPQSRYLWQQENTDPLSLHMQGSLRSNTLSGSFQGLGATLMEQLVANGGQRVSQSALLAGANSQADAVLLAQQQSELRKYASNHVTLNLTTASGATVTLGLYSSEKGLAVDAEVQNGTLSDTELKSLASLANGFESVISGLNQQPPRLKLDAMLKLDQNLFTGLQMNARLDLVDGEQQTFDLRLNQTTRSVSLQGPNGDLQLNLDTQGGSLLGGTAQRQAALNNYLAQFDAAQERGKGDAHLMTLFKDAFRQLNQVDDNSPRPAGHSMPNKREEKEEKEGEKKEEQREKRKKEEKKREEGKEREEEREKRGKEKKRKRRQEEKRRKEEKRKKKEKEEERRKRKQEKGRKRRPPNKQARTQEISHITDLVSLRLKSHHQAQRTSPQIDAATCMEPRTRADLLAGDTTGHPAQNTVK
ncbi:hypothetical protein [Pseudomonas sichuanensis]|uniref:hypothetical protein n=1 Tax=Pseudomonas sichuanensis TaxID=2213015 RepID=UPI00215DD8DB|nr:hypothetical protein [Pseudomonas sichuanensis]UVL87485.1 hypothetical protein LOY51_17030 [Pseudomonas sichuanensis]